MISTLLIVWAVVAVAMYCSLRSVDRQMPDFHVPAWTTLIASALWPLVLTLVIRDELCGSEFRP